MESIPGTAQVSLTKAACESNADNLGPNHHFNWCLESSIETEWMTFQIHPFPHDLTLLSGLADGATYMAKTDEIVTLNISTETGKPISYRVCENHLILILSLQLVLLQIYWDDGEITEENDTTTNSQVFTHTYADVSTASDVLHSFSLSRASTRSMWPPTISTAMSCLASTSSSTTWPGVYSHQSVTE